MASNGAQQPTDWTQFGLDPAAVSALQQVSPFSLQHEILNQALVQKNRSIIVTSPCNPPGEYDRTNTAIDTVVLQHAITGREDIRADARTAKQVIAQHGDAGILRDPAKGVFPSVLVVCPSSALVTATHERLSALSAARGLDLAIVAKSGRYVKPAAEIAASGFDVQHFPCADILIGTTTYLGRLLQDTHPSKKDEEDRQSLHLNGTTLTVWMDGKRLSEMDGGLLINPNSKRAPKTDTEHPLQSLKRAIIERKSNSVHIVVTTPLSEEERIGWGNEILKHSSPVTSTVQWNLAHKNAYVSEKLVPDDKEKRYTRQVWDWAVPLGKAMRHAQTMDKEHPFIVLIADNSPKISQVEVILHGKTSASLSGAASPHETKTDGNRVAGVIIYGPQKVFDSHADLKSRLNKSGEDLDVLWSHYKKHHDHIRTVIKLLDEAGEPIPPFMNAIRESQVKCPTATTPVSEDQRSVSDHNTETGDDENVNAGMPGAGAEGSMGGQAVDGEEHEEDAPGPMPQQQNPNGGPAQQLEREGSAEETASKNGGSSSKEKPPVTPTTNPAVAEPSAGTPRPSEPGIGSNNGTAPPPGAVSNGVPQNIDAMAPKPSTPPKPTILGSAGHKPTDSSMKGTGKPTNGMNGDGAAAKQNGAIPEPNSVGKGTGEYEK